MYKESSAQPALQAAPAPASEAPSEAMLDEIHNHLVYVLKEKLDWMDATTPEMALGGGHVVIRFERGGQRYVFRVSRRQELQQHKRYHAGLPMVGCLGCVKTTAGNCTLWRPGLARRNSNLCNSWSNANFTVCRCSKGSRLCCWPTCIPCCLAVCWARRCIT